MAVPASGELKLWDTLWNQELAGTKGENSLHSASVYAGFTTPDALSDFYGWSDVEVPSVSTQTSTAIAATSFTANGNVTDTGNEDVSRGFYLGTSPTYTSNPKYTLPGTQGTGPFSCSKTGLSAQTNYKVNAFACNSAGEAVGGQVSHTTSPPPFSPQYAVGLLTSNCVKGINYEGTGDSWQATAGAALAYKNPYTSQFVTFAAGSRTRGPFGVCVNFGPQGANNTCMVANATNKNCFFVTGQAYAVAHADNKFCTCQFAAGSPKYGTKTFVASGQVGSVYQDFCTACCVCVKVFAPSVPGSPETRTIGGILCYCKA